MLLQALCSISLSFVNSNWSYSPETSNLGQIRRFLEPCDHEIWRMTFKNNRAPLLCYFKLCAAFHSHWWLQTGVTVRNRPIWVKVDDLYRRAYIYISINTELLDGNKGHQEETHHPTDRFRRLFLDLLSMGWRGCASAIGAIKLPPSCSSQKIMCQSIHIV